LEGAEPYGTIPIGMDADCFFVFVSLLFFWLPRHSFNLWYLGSWHTPDFDFIGIPPDLDFILPFFSSWQQYCFPTFKWSRVKIPNPPFTNRWTGRFQDKSISEKTDRTGKPKGTAP
jgi:hypothetical protein